MHSWGNVAPAGVLSTKDFNLFGDMPQTWIANHLSGISMTLIKHKFVLNGLVLSKFS